MRQAKTNDNNKEGTMKYQIRVKASPMSDGPMWPNRPMAETRDEARAQLREAQAEIAETWASPAPVYIQAYTEANGKLIAHNEPDKIVW